MITKKLTKKYIKYYLFGIRILKKKKKYPIILDKLSPQTYKANFLGFPPKIINSKIIINGEQNILYCDKDVVLEDSIIELNGNNSLIYLSKGHYKIHSAVFNNSTLYIGENNYFNKPMRLICSEEKNIFIGNNNLFSLNIFFRNADAHLIYNAETKKRINTTQSIYVGDHIWISESCSILKGTNIHSGSVIGAHSLISKKIIPSNCIAAGSPSKIIKKNIFWKGNCVHSWTTKETQKNNTCLDENFIYKHSKKEFIPFAEIEEKLNMLKSANEKYLYLKNLPKSKNRFSNS